MSRKSAAAASTALSIAEYIDNYPGMPEGARAAMLLLKLDIISFLNYAWREVHNKMLLRRSIALDCLERTLSPIDKDQNAGRGKSFRDKKGFKKPGGRGRGQGRSAPTATITRPGQSKYS